MSLKKKYVKRIYIEEAYCDRCGAIMHHTGIILQSSNPIYPFECSECGYTEQFHGDTVPGVIRYEYEEDENV